MTKRRGEGEPVGVPRSDFHGTGLGFLRTSSLRLFVSPSLPEQRRENADRATPPGPAPCPSDRHAWLSAALERFERPLLGYALRLTGCPERARDVVQDVFIRLCRENPARLDGRLAEWLYTVCRNRATDLRRKDTRMTSLSAAAMEPEQATRGEGASEPRRAGRRSKSSSAGASQHDPPAVELAQREEAARVLRVMATLPARQQEAVRLKFQGGLSYQEIAAVMKTSANNVGVLLHTAIKTLRERLGAE